MNKHLKARIIATRSLATAFSLLIGILITAQWRSIPERVTNPVAPYSSLKETKDSLYAEQDELKNTIKDLQNSIEKAQKDKQDVNLTKEEIDDLDHKKALAGLSKLNGPGIIITYDDSKSAALSDESIVHAADLRDTVNLLWGSGAEAISINGQRVVINTAIDCIVNTILVNNTRISNPFTIEVIGDQNLLYERLTNPANLTQIHERKDNQGLIFEIKRNNDITVPMYDGSFEVKQSGGV